MARSASDEEITLRKRARRRLIGAIALTTLVVVTLPMLLDSEPRPMGHDIAVQIPSPDSGPYAPKGRVEPAARTDATAPAAVKADGPAVAAAAVAPGAADPAPASKPSRDAASAAEATPVVPQGAETRTAAAKATEAKATQAKAAEAKAAASRGPDPKDADARNFVVQLGAFSEASRASDRHAQLVKAGIRAYTEVIKTPTGDKTRVRAGPFPTRQAAEQANEQVKALGITEGIVVPRRY
jgi:DedD protein